MASGTLFIVGTPIGNLEDTTRRSERVLREANFVVAEDTRHTRKLLSHLGISGKMLLSFNAHSKERDLSRILMKLSEGAACAYVTDAGMPGISDPGASLVRAAAEAGHTVSSIPGPSAVTAAVSVSGMVEGPFVFIGFLPRKGKKRRVVLDFVTASPYPLVLFEAPTRLKDTLQQLAQLFPERRMVLCRELTKLHEERAEGTAADLAQTVDQAKGEITIVLEAGSAQKTQPVEVEQEIVQGLARGHSIKQIVAALRKRTGLGSRQLYEQVLLVKRARGDSNAQG